IDCATAAGFRIVSGGDAGTLAAGQSQTVSLTFTPGEAATFDGRVAISTSASSSPAIVTLHGTGDACTAPAVTLNPTSLAFGSQVINTTSAAKSFTLTNSGTAPLTITSITLTGANAGDFAFTAGNTAGTLAPNASPTVSVT